MRFLYPTTLFILLMLIGCDSPVQQTQPNVYYDVAGFVKRQIADLSVRQPTVSKAVRINQKRSQQTTHGINWDRELELFTQADINKPALRSSYQIIRADSLTYEYVLKPSEQQLTVRSLRVVLDSATRQPRRIEAILQTDNPLYSSERHLLLESGAVDRQPWQVRHYRLSGFQKLAAFDKNEFLVDGRVR